MTMFGWFYRLRERLSKRKVEPVPSPKKETKTLLLELRERIAREEGFSLVHIHVREGCSKSVADIVRGADIHDLVEAGGGVFGVIVSPGSEYVVYNRLEEHLRGRPETHRLHIGSAGYVPGETVRPGRLVAKAQNSYELKVYEVCSPN